MVRVIGIDELRENIEEGFERYSKEHEWDESEESRLVYDMYSCLSAMESTSYYYEAMYEETQNDVDKLKASLWVILTLDIICFALYLVTWR